MGLKLYPEESVQAIASAIRDKNGSSDTYTIGQMSQAIEDIPTGGGTDGDVIFIDYDGSITNSYTAQDFLALTAMPANPTHERLTAQGWNWTLSDAKNYVRNHSKLIVGQTYITTSGATEIDIDFGGDGLSFNFNFCVNGTANVDWGDGTTSTVTGSSDSTRISTYHTYASSGPFTIKINVEDGSTATFRSYNGSHALIFTNEDNSIYYDNLIKRIFIGNNLVLDTYACLHCESLESITLPFDSPPFGGSCINGCYSLKAVTIPIAGVYNNSNFLFGNSYSLEYVSLPNGITSIPESVFSNCSALKTITIPDSVTSLGNNTFKNCSSLKSITLSNSIVNIGEYCFDSCFNLPAIIMPSTINSAGLNKYAFTKCYSLKSIDIPSGLTTIGNGTFENCFSLADIIIPSSVTTIGQGAFNYNTALKEIAIPSSVTSIVKLAFQNCNLLGLIKFEGSTPPTAGLNAFSGIRPDCKIYVPTGSLSAYTSMSNYPDPNTYTYVEYTPE